MTTLFGRDATERVLKTLAAHGPLTNAQLEVLALPRHKLELMERLISSGILVKALVKRKHPERSDHWEMGLNAAHPIYGELRMLLCAMAGVKPNKKRPIRVHHKAYNLDGLFMTLGRLQSLIAIALAKHGQIYPSSIRRLYPRLNLWVISNMLRTWALDPKGFVRRVDRATRAAYYELNPAYPFFAPLRALLVRIGDVWPEYRIHAALEDELGPQSRRDGASRRVRENA
jgi:hypothetical protein